MEIKKRKKKLKGISEAPKKETRPIQNMQGIPKYLKDDDHTDYNKWFPKTDEEEKEKRLILNIHGILEKGFTAKQLSKNYRYNNDEFKKTPKQIINLINRKKVDYNLLDKYLGNAVINYNKNNFDKIYESILSNQSKLDNKKMVEIYEDITNVFDISCFFCKKENEAEMIYSGPRESKYRCKICKTIYCIRGK